MADFRIEKLKNMLEDSRYTVAVCGSGMMTENGFMGIKTPEKAYACLLYTSAPCPGFYSGISICQIRKPEEINQRMETSCPGYSGLSVIFYSKE